MQLRTSVILVVIALFAVDSAELAAAWQAKPIAAWQEAKPIADDISGEWEAALTGPRGTLQMTLNLKLKEDKVTGTSESSRFGRGAISNGSWANNKMKITVETRRTPLTLTGTLQNGKLVGKWELGHLNGKWDAEKK